MNITTNYRLTNESIENLDVKKLLNNNTPITANIPIIISLRFFILFVFKTKDKKTP